ncbi:MAG: DUF2357 domain-containing protein, partial [Chloroflexi bacterium]|nr:DUF2357 domain-containing protein [Chloroflexota bacterium]
CQPRVANLQDPLPCHGPAFSADGFDGAVQTFDLPVSERYENEDLRLFAPGHTYSFRLSGQVPRRKGAGSGSQGKSSGLPEFVDTMVGVMRELRFAAEYVAGRVKPGKGQEDEEDCLEQLTPVADEFEQGGRLLLARLPWLDAAKCLLVRYEQPRMDVIVRIARDYERDLVALAESPRRMLRRERQRTPVGRVQQVDSACLAWLVRQPGRTALEKAGPTQQILSVVRDEDYDTLENRVLKDFVQRSIAVADLYIREHSGRYSQSRRYKLVAGFRERCRLLLRDTPLVQVRSLPAVPQPNYVLLHDDSYRKLWGWYLRLIRRQQQFDEAWRWQKRLWADTVRLCVACEFLRLTEEGWSKSYPFRQDLWIRDEQESGCWMPPVDWPGPVLVTPPRGREIVVECVHPHSLTENEKRSGLPIAEWLGKTGADLVLLFTPLGSPNDGLPLCLFVWAIHSAAEDPADERVQSQTMRAREALRRLTVPPSKLKAHLKGLILRSSIRGGARDLPSFGEADDVAVYGACVPADPAEWQKEGVLAMRKCLHKCLSQVSGIE